MCPASVSVDHDHIRQIPLWTRLFSEVPTSCLLNIPIQQYNQNLFAYKKKVKNATNSYYSGFRTFYGRTWGLMIVGHNAMWHLKSSSHLSQSSVSDTMHKLFTYCVKNTYIYMITLTQKHCILWWLWNHDMNPIVQKSIHGKSDLGESSRHMVLVILVSLQASCLPLRHLLWVKWQVHLRKLRAPREGNGTITSISLILCPGIILGHNQSRLS